MRLRCEFFKPPALHIYPPAFTAAARSMTKGPIPTSSAGSLAAASARMSPTTPMLKKLAKPAKHGSASSGTPEP